ncbi:hypothetical protein B0O80DRAFT_186907 [Mortierella sp. GBAus27b]|nr:hypothetical protein B0O80DRAFT_186907 [Mortierella sp. GBAus27b]
MGLMNPLDIPEIRTLVGQFLPQSDLARYLQVCKSWHNSFLPLVWSTVSIELYRPIPTLEVFRRHRLLVRELHYRTVILTPYNRIQCPNLKSLSVIDKQNYLEAWSPGNGLDSLSMLELDGINITADDTSTFWSLCTRLEWISINDITIAELPHISVVFERLRHLTLSLLDYFPFRQQLDLIGQCPNLISLKWTFNRTGLFDDLDDLDGLATRFSAGTWSKLCELDLVRFCVSDAPLAIIIGSMQRIIKLDVLHCELGVLSLAALRRHFSTLRSLGAKNKGANSGSIITEILSSCPQLESLHAGSITSHDVIDGPPWVCGRSMKTLAATFRVMPGQDLDDHHRRIFKRLSQLVNLRSLTLDGFYIGDGDTVYLELRLEKGLAQLATLKHLETLFFIPFNHQLGSIDVEWMIDNWKNLKLVCGRLNSAKGVNDQLIGMFERAGINHLI